MTPKEWDTLYPRFAMHEIYSPGSYIALQESDYRAHIVSFDLMDLLQGFAEEISVPCFINHGHNHRRGVRTPFDNYMLYKEMRQDPFTFSWHVAGRAVDITCQGLTPKEVFERARDFRIGDLRFTGFGVYKTWTHLDVRPWHGDGFAYWEG